MSPVDGDVVDPQIRVEGLHLPELPQLGTAGSVEQPDPSVRVGHHHEVTRRRDRRDLSRRHVGPDQLRMGRIVQHEPRNPSNSVPRNTRRSGPIPTLYACIPAT